MEEVGIYNQKMILYRCADGTVECRQHNNLNLPVPTKALAHSLDEHKRLVAAKQNQELLLANHFKSINLGEPTGQNNDVLT